MALEKYVARTITLEDQVDLRLINRFQIISGHVKLNLWIKDRYSSLAVMLHRRIGISIAR